jgi:hypothetical protein
MLRRSLALAGVVATLLVPGSAAAYVHSYAGGLTGTAGTVKFTDKHRPGRARKVVDFSWMKAPAQCKEGPVDVDGHFGFPMRVRDGRFHGLGLASDASSGDVIGYARVVGEFHNRGADATGTLRVSGDVPGYGHNCETHRLDWTATRQ